jgi:hypothetical protein
MEAGRPLYFPSAGEMMAEMRETIFVVSSSLTGDIPWFLFLREFPFRRWQF